LKVKNREKRAIVIQMHVEGEFVGPTRVRMKKEEAEYVIEGRGEGVKSVQATI
jgi:hypothetical protein